MRDLELGDVVPDGNRKYEPVYSFGHRISNHILDSYLQIRTESTQLQISEQHIVLVMRNDARKTLPANLVQRGDLVEVRDKLEAVQDIRKVYGGGAYAPFTPSGVLVVNNVQVSCFASLQESETIVIYGVDTGLTHQWLARVVELPHRVWCYHLGGVCQEETYINDMPAWVYYPYMFYLWQQSVARWMQVLVWIPVLTCFGLLILVDFVCSHLGLVMAVEALMIVSLVGVHFRVKAP